ncbi:hypothetical protein [Haliangium ochraceum]|uniref:Uncharacterized protein n=1 Tax=Haliangium ochraceum (strain DSM 14365 / JCM 11303 / SMP-2) TaxID=502025 RepID=D0LLU3_HALO1|nr:hypothetical protein [Haliangium ochraceum]ACY15121.1 hypothetical protein Hoch_2587 [Haliangium ochraceum DSM 14365]
MLGIEPLRERDASVTPPVDAMPGEPEPDAAVVYAPFSCDWKPASVRRVASLQDLPEGENRYGGEIAVAPGERQMRAFLERSSPNGDYIEMWTMSGGDAQLVSFPGAKVLSARRVAGNRVLALIVSEVAGANGQVLSLVKVPDGNDGSESVSGTGIGPLLEMTNLQGSFIQVDPRSANSDVVVVVSYRPENSRRFQADLLYWDADEPGPSAQLPFDIDEAQAYAAGGYDIVGLVRDDDGRNHIFLGSPFEGAPHTRHFIVDDVFEDLAAPVRFIEELLVGLQRRFDGSYLTAYAEPDPLSGRLALRMGVLEAGDIGTLADLPTGGQPFFSTEHMLVLGTRDDTGKRLSLVMTHRAGQVRFNGDLPFPDVAIFPVGDWRLERLSAQVAPEQSFFDSAGGDLQVTWTIEAAAGYQELYYGELRCTPAPQTETAQ